MAGYNLTAQINLHVPKGVLKREYGRIQTALKKPFLITVRVSSAQANKQLAKLNTSAQSLQKSMGGLGFTRVSNEAQKMNRSFRASSTATKQQRVAMDDLSQTSSATALQLTFLSTAVLLVANSLRKGIQFIVEFESKLAAVEQVSGISGAALQELGQNAINMQKQFGNTAIELLDLQNELGRAGVEMTELGKQSELLSKLLLNVELNSENVSSAYVLMDRIFQLTGRNLASGFEVVVQLSKELAISADDIIQGMSTAGNVAKLTGLQFTDLASIIAVVGDVTKKSGSEVGTGLKFIISRLTNTKEVAKNLSDLGIELFKDNQFVGTLQALDLINKRLKEVVKESDEYYAILAEVAGVRQKDKAAALFNNYDKIVQKLKEMRAVAGTGTIDKDAAIAAATLEKQFVRLQGRWNEFYKDLKETTAFQTLVTNFVDLSSAILEVAKAIKPLIPALTALSAIKLAQLTSQFIPLVAARGLGGRFFAGQGAGGGRRGGALGAGGIATTAVAAGGTLQTAQFQKALKRSTTDIYLNTKAISQETIVRKSGVKSFSASTAAFNKDIRFGARTFVGTLSFFSEIPQGF